jgi:hypothetical protein
LTLRGSNYEPVKGGKLAGTRLPTPTTFVNMPYSDANQRAAHSADPLKSWGGVLAKQKS